MAQAMKTGEDEALTNFAQQELKRLLGGAYKDLQLTASERTNLISSAVRKGSEAGIKLAIKELAFSRLKEKDPTAAIRFEAKHVYGLGPKHELVMAAQGIAKTKGYAAASRYLMDERGTSKRKKAAPPVTDEFTTNRPSFKRLAKEDPAQAIEAEARRAYGLSLSNPEEKNIIAEAQFVASQIGYEKASKRLWQLVESYDKRKQMARNEEEVPQPPLVFSRNKHEQEMAEGALRLVRLEEKIIAGRTDPKTTEQGMLDIFREAERIMQGIGMESIGQLLPQLKEERPPSFFERIAAAFRPKEPQKDTRPSESDVDYRIGKISTAVTMLSGFLLNSPEAGQLSRSQRNNLEGRQDEALSYFAAGVRSDEKYRKANKVLDMTTWEILVRRYSEIAEARKREKVASL